MSNKRYDVMSPRPGREEGKTFWHRVGTAFDGEKGIAIYFDSLPLPDKDGRVTVRLFEPRERETTRERPSDVAPPMGNGPKARSGGGGGTVTLDDSIPFAPEWR